MTRLTMAAVISFIGISLMFTGQSSAKIDPKSVVGVWLFDEGKEDVAKDSFGNGHDGEIIGDVERVEGKFDNALSFPGTKGNYASVPHEDSLNLVAYTISAWTKLQPTGDYGDLVWKISPANYCITIADRGFPYTEFMHSGEWRKAHGKTVVTDGQWHHVAATYNKKTLRFYVDGVVEDEQAITDTPDTNFSPITISGPRPVKGIIDEVGLFNEGLTESDIKNIMTKGLESALGITAVEPAGKLATTWGSIKNQ